MLLMIDVVRWFRMLLAALICVAWFIAAIPVLAAFIVILAVMYLSDAVSQRGVK
jgi:hypothetical protein